jgi:hypothetical protein
LHDLLAICLIPQRALASNLISNLPTLLPPPFNFLLTPKLCHVHTVLFVAQMPQKKSKNRGASSSPAATTPAATGAAATTVSSALAVPTGEVPQAAIAEACRGGGDHGQLRKWVRQGVRVTSWEPLCAAAGAGLVYVVRLLVNGLGGDLNQCDESGFSPLHIAIEKRHWAVMRCLVKEFGADGNKEIYKVRRLFTAQLQRDFWRWYSVW